ncbi:hypothetical protein [Nocardia aurantiaca]|uniref:Uncharacterized protein n=1 Tax=Nocardia aurantiaca TaxID=2675850 RepID=A0A6I3KWR8_9NOCA|nr:hypothetical protein [Nocardia aurantiaca]MTE12514.1 hypothetical protein [Nocardia aurantiaca]
MQDLIRLDDAAAGVRVTVVIVFHVRRARHVEDALLPQRVPAAVCPSAEALRLWLLIRYRTRYCSV